VPPTKIKDIDFKPRARASKRAIRFKRIHVLALGLSGVTGLSLLLSGQQQADALLEASSGVHEMTLPLPIVEQTPEPSEPSAPVATAAAEPTSAEPVAALEELAPQNWQQITVRSGDTLAGIFGRVGLDAKTMYAVLGAGEAAKALVKIFPKEEISFLVDGGQLKGLRYRVDEAVTLHVDAGDEGFTTSLVATPLERRRAHAAGAIDNSLFVAGKEAGLSDALIMELAGMFGWDVDFALDIRAGDRFAVVYEELYRDGEKLRDGGIVAAEFVNQGRTYRAVAYQDAEGNREFYTPEGRSMRKAFLRSPVDFRRISSGFNPNRLHPVLRTKRPHRGVDYAAATGTPIRAAGDGKILHLGWKGGYGRTVIVQHGSRYSTLYAHMSRYGSGVKSGSKVRQGQIIGHVGSSGLATGPHLHYEFQVDGVHRNPLTVSLPEAQPISKQLMADFLQQTAPLIAQLDVVSRSQVALRQEQ
jgi:murein DD-endopeptidase MepM/ murein hydrolase activator NlpD